MWAYLHRVNEGVNSTRRLEESSTIQIALKESTGCTCTPWTRLEGFRVGPAHALQPAEFIPDSLSDITPHRKDQSIETFLDSNPPTVASPRKDGQSIQGKADIDDRRRVSATTVGKSRGQVTSHWNDPRGVRGSPEHNTWGSVPDEQIHLSYLSLCQIVWAASHPITTGPIAWNNISNNMNKIITTITTYEHNK